MVEQEMMNVMKSYNSAFRTWSNVFVSWSKPIINFPFELGAINMENWSKHFQSHQSHLKKKNGDYFKTMMGMYFPPESINNVYKAVGKSKNKIKKEK